jgi:hypothetical protein
MLVDEKDATSLPPAIFKFAFASIIGGWIAIILLGVLSKFDLIKQPLAQYVSMAVAIVLFNGMGLIGVETRFCRLRSYIICMSIFIATCIFFLIDVPFLSHVARLIMRILFRDVY